MADPLDRPLHPWVVCFGPPKIEIVELDPVIRRGSHVFEPVPVRARPVRALQELVLVWPGDPVVVGHVVFQQVSRHRLVELVEIDATGDVLQFDELRPETSQDVRRLVRRTVVPDDEVVALFTQVPHRVFHEVPVVVAKQHAQQPQPRLVAPAAPWEEPARNFGHLRSKDI